MTDELEALRRQWTRLEPESAGSTQQRQTARAESIRLQNAAYEFYKQDQDENARSLFHRAYEAAVKAGDRARVLENLEWEGDCLYHLGRLREALSCLLQLEGGAKTDKAEYWAGLRCQVDVAIMLPLSLHSISKLLDRCRREMVQLGLNASEGMLLLTEGVLAYYRGDDQTALEKVREAMAIYDASAYPRVNIEYHYYSLIDALLNVGCREEAEQWLSRYEGVTTGFEFSKELNILNLRRRMALADGDYIAAWRYAQRHLQRSREAERSPYESLCNYCDTAIQCGHLFEARSALAELLRHYRNSENGHSRYRIRRLTGDYHRALARQASIRENCERDTLRKHEQDAQRQRSLAVRFYCAALKLGQELDARLQCNWREQQMRERIISLDS